MPDQELDAIVAANPDGTQAAIIRAGLDFAITAKTFQR